MSSGSLLPLTSGQLLRPGVTLTAGGILCEVMECAADQVCLKRLGTQQTRWVDVGRLGQQIAEGVVSIAKLVPRPVVTQEAPHELARVLTDLPIDLRSEAALRVFVEKHRWLRELHRAGLVVGTPHDIKLLILQEVERRLGQKCPFKLSTLYKASLVLRKHGGDPRALLPMFHLRGGKGRGRLDPHVEMAVEHALDSAEGEKDERLIQQDLWDSVVARVRQINVMGYGQEPLRPPCLSTVSSRVHQRFSAYEIARRRFGTNRANRMFRENGARIVAERALEVAEADDKDTRVFLVDDQTGLPWGRCWMTAVVDQNTDAVLGMEISEIPRSRWSLASAIHRSIFPKDMHEPQYQGCHGAWECYGLPGVLLFDNASYTHCLSIEGQLLELGCEVSWARPYAPTDKSKVEHFNGEYGRWVQTLPGFCGRSGDRDGLEKGLGTAVFTLSAFPCASSAFVVDNYMSRPRGSGRSIFDGWRRQMRLCPPIQPRFRRDDILLNTLPYNLKLRDAGGLLRLGLRYQSDELAALRRKVGWRALVRVRINPSNLRIVYVQDPDTGFYLVVPCIDNADYVNGLTEYQQKLIIKMCRHLKLYHPAYEQLVYARERLVHETIALAKSKKMRDRLRAQRMKDKSANRSSGGNGAGKEAQVIYSESELERLTRELAEIEQDCEEVDHLGLEDAGDAP